MTMIAALYGVSLNYGSRAVLRNVSATFAAGEVIALVGPNGAGKSSLLKVLAGLIKPGAGGVTLDGRDTATLTPADMARQVAYLPQARAIHWPMAVRSIVALGRLPHQASGTTTPAQDALAIDDALSQMDIADFTTRAVLALSGGEQARVLMARALAQSPRLLLADEPTAGLDLRHQLALMQALRTRAATGTASIVALHDLGLAARFADKIVLLADGQIVAAGLPQEVLTEARLAAVYGVELVIARVDGVPVFVPRGPRDVRIVPPAIV